jgi:recombination protein RecT
MSRQTKPTNDKIQKQREQYVGIRDYLDARKGLLAQVLPKYLDSERMIRLALGAAQRQPQLLDCTPRSWLAALMDCSYYGLEPNPALGHAYLVPFRNKHAGNRQEVTFIPGYKGLILLARTSGTFQTVDVRVVYANEFKSGRFVETPHDPGTPWRHEPLYGDARGAQFGFYAAGWIRQGERPAFRFCPMEEIRETRSRSRAADSGPWKDHFTAMAKKTAVRRLMAVAPIKPRSKLDRVVNQERVLQQGRVAYAADWTRMIGDGEQTPTADTAPEPPHDPETGEVYADGEQPGLF